MKKLTDEQIAELKKKHGKLFLISVDGHSCILKKPSRKALGYATMAGKENPIKFNEVMLRECWVDGDEEMKTDDDLFLAVSQKISEVVSIKEAELVEL